MGPKPMVADFSMNYPDLINAAVSFLITRVSPMEPTVWTESFDWVLTTKEKADLPPI